MGYDTREDALNTIGTNHQLALDFAEAANTDRIEIGYYFPYIDDEYIKGAFSQTMSAIFNLLKGIRCCVSDTPLNPVNLMLGIFLGTYTWPYTEGVTWENIIQAWDDAPIEGWARTIAAIDQMRKEIWHKPLELRGPYPIFQ